ncbi:hypothetical protein K450DRAFT_239798 [Umbelopsis ramanniana AG]|uniref:F-box domain-containing protein n=1 Tax=Umbelopsis ramanniana AG TaxID=1314678 RepID=A0AAD5EBN1_UMBRA|nr:uncharacterized protein K450DRAFT_239798 [Umbelopsis ramanniana AG]KAI8579935.1 hypothetical protein K450DRAFT_239798 [Umbelopsis ramanniana AG]
MLSGPLKLAFAGSFTFGFFCQHIYTFTLEMVLLFQLPLELLNYIADQLPSKALAQLCLTCHDLHMAILPTLYAHVQLSFRSHIKQLEYGLQVSPYLANTINQCTRKLTLVSRQSGTHWVANDVRFLLQITHRVESLHFHDFHVLMVEHVCQVASALPLLKHLEFRYCNLAAEVMPSSPIRNSHRPESQQGQGSTDALEQPKSDFSRTSYLTLVWTDFSSSAISTLLRHLPGLQVVDFGANHNRIYSANDSAIFSLSQYCPKVQVLHVGLQQVREQTLCETIRLYGSSLTCLDVKCDSVQTLKAVAAHAESLQELTVRAAGPGSYGDDMIHVLRQCKGLGKLEMVCWMLEDVPRCVWRAIEAVARRAKQSIRNRDNVDANWMYFLEDHVDRLHGSNSGGSQTSTSEDGSDRVQDLYSTSDSWNNTVPSSTVVRSRRRRDVGSIKKTVALSFEELSEIRKEVIPSPQSGH